MKTLKRFFTKIGQPCLAYLAVAQMLLLASKTDAQSLAGYLGAPCTLETYADIMSPCTANNYIFLQYNFGTGKSYSNWTLKVKAKGDFTNAKHSVPVEYVSLRFNRVSTGNPSASAMGVSSIPLPLSTSDVTVINRSPAPLNSYTEHVFDMILQGGNHLLVEPGTYSTTITFSVVDDRNKTVASKDFFISFVINYNNSCSGISLGSYSGNQVSFSILNELMAGKTAQEYLTVQYGASNSTCQGWSLKVRALGSFSNGSYQIEPEHVMLRFNRVNSGGPSASAIGVSTNPVALSTSDVTLIDHSQAGFQKTYTTHTFDMIIEGGNHLLTASNGAYSAYLLFTLYNENNQIVSETQVRAIFQVQSTMNYSFTLLLQNTADQVSLAFNTTSDIVNGISLTKLNGLKITGYSPYQVIVKTSSEGYSSGTSSYILPAEVIKLEVTPPSGYADIACYTHNLSPTGQVFISNPMSSSTYQMVQYNLRYFTDPLDSRIVSVPEGTYSSNVLFIIVPQ
ncbi:hypothetical protein [Arcticibacter tournemirensis]|uniref:CUB-like domain-containing protein n=1 Tax=Arcticibacter tournemirensis TaxID=699437 RepID=A0A4Q0MG87_9SPHI|nr:hypothetical protein [Arcticibacter tournemirensis]RXF72480.1 hypothetical protein EKH83_01810 [Arcticibacter tournemirensis]